MAVMPLNPPTLQSARLRMRAFRDSDTEAIFALRTNLRVLRYWDAPPWTEMESAKEFILRCQEIADLSLGIRWAVDRLEDGAFIGWCSLNRWNPEFRSASLGYCFDDAVWGSGYATEAIRALLSWAFDNLDLNRVQAETDTRNGASLRVLEKLGFTREGTFREDCIVNGDISDTALFGLLRREWQPL